MTKTSSVTVTDVSGSSHTYTLSVVQAASSAAQFAVSPSTLAVPANGSATFTVALTSSGVALTGAFKDFQGDVVVAGSGPTLRLPLWVRFQ